MIAFKDKLLQPNKSPTFSGDIGTQYSVCSLKGHWREEKAII